VEPSTPESAPQPVNWPAIEKVCTQGDILLENYVLH